MKRNLMKKFSAVFATTVLLFTTVFSVSIFANAASNSFSPRLSTPESGNKYYFSNLNVFYASGYGMPNCTAYAYGRAYEILGYEPDLSWASAGQWYDYNRTVGAFDYGTTPRVGAIACWSYSGGGHVAVVEQIDSYGNMTLSNSAWNRNDLFFYLTYAHTSDSNPGGNSWWTFQGYIYLLDEAAPTTTQATQPATKATQPTTKATQPATTKATVPATTVNHTSSYKTGVYQTTGSLNFRSGASINFNSTGYINANTTVTVTQTYYADGYNWGKTTYNGQTGWIALEYAKYIGEKTEPTTAAPTTVPATTTAPKIKNLRGDVNGDGQLTILDATIMQRYLARMTELSNTQLRVFDFDGNNKNTIDDVTSLQRYLLTK